MPIVRVDKDLDNHTMTVVAEYDAPAERVWQLYADPRQLERFWGPPSWPATVVEHDLSPGGRVTYFMTGPGGEKSAGYGSTPVLQMCVTSGGRDDLADHGTSDLRHAVADASPGYERKTPWRSSTWVQGTGSRQWTGPP